MPPKKKEEPVEEEPEGPEDPTPQVVHDSFVHLVNVTDRYARTYAYKQRTIKIERKLKSELEFHLQQGNGYTQDTGIFISRIVLGSVYDVCRLMYVGDEVIDVNGDDVTGADVCDVMRRIFDSTSLSVTLKIMTPFARKQSRRRWKRVEENKVSRLEDYKLLNMKIVWGERHVYQQPAGEEGGEGGGEEAPQTKAEVEAE